MAAPYELPLVEEVFRAKPRDLTTRLGCQRYMDDLVWEMYNKDRNWGHLKKKPGQIQTYNNHAVDNPLYLSGSPGLSQAVDVIAGSMSTSAKLQWSPDTPRYSLVDWKAPNGPDNLVLPPHNCKLGTSLFPAMAHYKSRMNWLLNQLNFLRTNEVKVVRIMAVVGNDFFNTGDGTYADPWLYSGSWLHWSDYDQILTSTINTIYSFGIQVALTYVGGAGQVPTLDSQLRVADRIARLVKPIKERIFVHEMWNEHPLTGGTKSNIRQMARIVREIIPNATIALDTPTAAMNAPVGHQEDLLPQETTEFYLGSAADCITPQWDRSQPSPRYMGAHGESLKKISMEPRGPGASAGGNTQNEIYLSNDMMECVLEGYILYILHTGAGVHGELGNPQFANDPHINIFDYQNMGAILDYLNQVQDGHVPTEVTVNIPYPGDDAWKPIGKQLEYDYGRANQSLNGDSAVWFSRTIWDMTEGDETGKIYSLKESVDEHRKEWCAALGIHVDSKVFY